jgi:cellulose synthase/poly-beta-1,6-N-acetylglucosamine synthase-like glycosyltransferase
MIDNNWVDPVLCSILFFPLFLVVFDSIHRLLFLIIAHLPKKETMPDNHQNADLRLLILIVARNEQNVVQQTLLQIRPQTTADNTIKVVVLADHCTDQTAQISSEIGAKVYLRCVGSPGKAQALSWFVKEGQDSIANADVIAILDADTLIDNEFCEKIRMAFVPGVEVVQGFVNSISNDRFPWSTLASFSEILSQKIDDIARSRLHWSVPLRGTGMAFRSEIFCQVCQNLGSQVDDIEVSVRLAELNIPVRFSLEAKICDPKSDEFIGLAKQRGRWLKGQRQIWRIKQRNILKLLRSGLANWSLIHAMFIKPKTALVFMKVVLLSILLAGFVDSGSYKWIFAIVLSSILIDLTYYIIGLKYVTNTSKYSLALISAPLFLVLWTISWGFSLLPGQGWLRAREK